MSVATVSGTTTSEGLLALMNEYAYWQGYRILFAYTPQTNVTVVPSHGSGPNYLVFTDIVSGNRLADTAVTAVMYMLKL